MTVLTPTALAVTYPAGCPTSGKACFKSGFGGTTNTSNSDWDLNGDTYSNGDPMTGTYEWKNSMNTYYAEIKVGTVWMCKPPLGSLAQYGRTYVSPSQAMTAVSVHSYAC